MSDDQQGLLPYRSPQRVVVIGAGGVASYFLNNTTLRLFLKFMPGAKFSIYDGKTLEPRKLERQDFLVDEGNKADRMVERLSQDERFKGLVFQSFPEFVTEENIGLVIQEKNLIFSFVDNRVSQKLISDAVGDLSDAVLIYSANEMYTSTTLTYIKAKGEDVTPPLTVWPEIAQPTDKAPWRMSCEEAPQVFPQLAMANEAAAFGAKEALYRLLTDNEPIVQIRKNFVRAGSRSL